MSIGHASDNRPKMNQSQPTREPLRSLRVPRTSRSTPSLKLGHPPKTMVVSRACATRRGCESLLNMGGTRTMRQQAIFEAVVPDSA